MAFFDKFFGKKADPASAGTDSQAAASESEAFRKDERRARAFFEHAKTMAEASNYDYAVELLVKGLRFEPDNIFQHEALREVAKKRRMAGGKPAGALDKLKSAGKTPLEKMATAERLWSMQPMDAEMLLTFMNRVSECHRPDLGMDMREVLAWASDILLKERSFEKQPTKDHYVQATQYFHKTGLFAQAVEACRMAVNMDRSNPALLQWLKDLDAEKTVHDSMQKKSFKESIKDSDEARKLEMEQNSMLTGDKADEVTQRARKLHEEKPDDIDLFNKFIATLTKRDSEKHDEMAIDELKKAWEKSDQYRFKFQMGEIRRRMYDRKLREFKKLADTGDAEAKKKYLETARAKLLFEVDEFAERVKNNPTERMFKYEYGRRLIEIGKIEEAIPMLQTAKTDTRITPQACLWLGRAFLKQSWFELAITSLTEGLTAHASPTDVTGLELNYSLMEAKEKLAVKTNDPKMIVEAQKHASAIMQTNFNYRDIRARLDGLAKLLDQLSKPNGTAAT